MARTELIPSKEAVIKALEGLYELLPSLIAEVESAEKVSNQSIDYFCDMEFEPIPFTPEPIGNRVNKALFDNHDLGRTIKLKVDIKFDYKKGGKK